MGSWDVKYPINFTPDGDTTSQAIEKLMNEVSRIYDLLNRVRKLDAGNLPPDDPVTGHVWIDTSKDPWEIKEWNGSEWERKAKGYETAVIPSGTKMLFKQNAAPAGWTFVAEDNDRVLLNTSVETDGGSTGGSWTISGLTNSHQHDFNHQHILPMCLATGYPDGQIHGNSGSGSFWGHVDMSPNSYTIVDGETDVSTSVTSLLARCSYPIQYNGGANDGIQYTQDSTNPTVSSDGSWRPAYVKVITCQKD